MAIKPTILGGFIEKRCELSFGHVAVGLTASALATSGCQELLGKFIQGSVHALVCGLQKDPGAAKHRTLSDRNSAMLALVVISAPPVDVAALASPKVLYIYRNGPDNEPLQALSDVCCCEVLHARRMGEVGSASSGLAALLATLATPIVFEKQSESSQSYDADVLAQATRLKLVLRLLEDNLVCPPDMPPPSAPADAWSHWIACIEDEVTQTNEARATQQDAGLHLEVRHWVGRAIRFHAMLEAIEDSFPDSTYFSLPSSLRSRLASVVTRLREALYEAQDCARYLLALEPWFDVLYCPTGVNAVREATAAVPTVVDMLAQGIATSRFLSTPHNAAVLFQQLANRLAAICEECVKRESGDSVWRLEPSAALSVIAACKALHTSLHESFAAARGRLAAVPTGPQLEFSPSRAFHRLNAVTVRLTNLGSMLQAFQHLEAASRLPIHGMSALNRHVQLLTDILMRRKYNLLDVSDITMSDAKRELVAPDVPVSAGSGTQWDLATPASRRAGRTPMFPPLSLPSSAVTGHDVSLEWKTPAVGAVDTDHDRAFHVVAWSPAPTLQRPKSVASGRPVSLRATIHLRSASALAKRSPVRSSSPTRRLPSPSSVGSGSKSRARSLSPSEAHLVFHPDVLSPVGMSADAAVEADAVLSAEVRFRNRHSRTSRQLSPTRNPGARMSTGTVNKRFMSSLALRREALDEFFVQSDSLSSDSGVALSFAADFAAFQSVYSELMRYVGSLIVRHVRGQSSSLQAAVGIGMAVATGVVAPLPLHKDVVTCLNEISEKLGSELKRVRSIAVDPSKNHQSLSLWCTRLDRIKSLLHSVVPKLPAGTLHASSLPVQLENLAIVSEELRQHLQAPVSMVSVESIASVLSQPVMTTSADGLPTINWLPLFDTLWETAKHMVSAGQRLPLHVEDFCGRRESIFRLRASLQSLLDCVKELVAMLRKDPYFRPLLEPAVTSLLNRIIEAGTRQYTWGSAQAVAGIESLVQDGIHVLSICHEVHTIVLSQVEAGLRGVRQLQFFHAPESSEPVSLEDFVTSAVNHITKTEGSLTVLFAAIEKGCQLASYSAMSLYPNDSQEFQSCRAASKGTLKVVESRAVSALTVAICDSLRSLLKTFHHGSNRPVVHVGLRLQIPNAVLHPTLDTIQRALCGLARSIVAVGRAVSPLVNAGPAVLSSARSPSSKQSIYPMVASSKAVACLLLRVAGCTRLATSELDSVVVTFTEFDRLWQDNRDACVDDFVKASPDIASFVEQLQEYGDASQRLSSMCAQVPVAWMVVDTSMLCRALSKEAVKWQQGYGRALVDWVYRQVDALRDFLDTTEDELRRPVVQLKQLSECLLTLNAVDSVDAEVALRMDPLLKAHDIFQMFTLAHEFDVQELAAALQDRWSKLQQLAAHIREDMLCREREFQSMLATEKASLTTAVELFVSGWSQRGPGLPGLSLTVARQRLEKFQEDLSTLQRRIAIVARVSAILGFHFVGFPAVMVVKTDLERLESVLTLLYEVHSSIDRYKQRTWKELRFDAVSQDMAAYAAAARALPQECHALPSYKTLSKLVDQFSAILPLLIALSHPTVTVRHWRALESGMNSGIPTSTGRLSTGMFLLSAVLSTPLLKHRALVESITYAARKEAEVETKLTAVVRQWETAALVVAPSVTAANHGRKLLILHQQSTSELLSALEEAQMTLSVLSSSRYHHPYAHELEDWSLRLTTVRDTLEPALAVQSTLLYLENVFSSVKAASFESSGEIGSGEDLAAQLPEESQVFASVCKLWGRLMSRIEATPSVIHVCVIDTALAHSLSFLEAQLDRCKRALTGYLARKRHRFPRFYFLSDTALLEVLALSTGMQSLKRHLSNMFDSVVDVIVHPNVRSRVVGLTGLGQHRLQFDPAHHVNTRMHVEDWLRALLDCSRASIRLFLSKGTQCVGTAATTGKSLLSVLADAQSKDSTQAVVDALLATPAQVLVWLHRLLWTLLCEGALQQWIGGDKSALHRLRLHYAREFRHLIDWMALLRGDTSTPSPALSTLEAIVTLESHHCDVIASLATIAVPSACDAFEWKRHLRCYPATKSDVVREKGGDELHRFPWPSSGSADNTHSRAEVLDVALEYSYEYVSGHSVLVVTPLTNRCQIAMSSAIRHGLGTAALGPAGTGKTETVKDVGRALGRFVVVTGCSEDTGPESLARLYLGAAKSGAWLDLDEFNRLRPDVLSVAASQVACVLTALRQRSPTFLFTDGYVHALRFRESALFITMNPDYAGRSPLPDNLQAYFRSVAMVVPDSLAILRVKFACMGYTTAARLASRLDQLFQAARNTIPQRKHYEFSLRLMLSVLKHLHSIKRETKAAGTISTSRLTMRRRRSEAIVLPSEMEEAQLVRDAVCVMVLPNLVPEDRNPFLDLLDLCFQGVLGPSPSIAAGDLRPSDSVTALRSPSAKSVEVDRMVEYATAAAGSRGLIASNTWVRAFTELANVTASRLGVIVLGPSHSGKSGLIQSLCDARCAVVSPVKECRVYPKALPLPYLYGELDALTHEWTDGVLTRIWRKTVADSERRASSVASAPLPTLRSIARAVRWMSASSPKAFQVAGRERRSSSPSRPSPPRRLSMVSAAESPWFVLDGPVEPIWVESLNSVLDDTRTLTLGNGDRLLVDGSMRFLIETDSLEHASPATVSRCGIVCVGSSVASWKNTLESFCCSQPLPLGRYLLVYFSAVFRPVMSLFARVCRASEPGHSRSAADVSNKMTATAGSVSGDDVSILLPVSQWMKQMLSTSLALGKQLLPHTTSVPGVYERPASPSAAFVTPNSPSSMKSPVMSVSTQPTAQLDSLSGLMSVEDAVVWNRICSCAVVTTLGGFLSPAGCVWLHDAIRNHGDFVVPDAMSAASNLDFAWRGSEEQCGLYRGAAGYSTPFPSGASVEFNMPDSADSGSAHDTIFHYFLNEAAEWESYSGRYSCVVSKGSGNLGMGVPKAISTVLPLLRSPNNLWSVAFEPGLDAVLPITGRSGSHMFVSTPHGCRLFYQLALASEHGGNVMLSGPAASGKTSVALRFGHRLSQASLAGNDPSLTPVIAMVVSSKGVSSNAGILSPKASSPRHSVVDDRSVLASPAAGVTRPRRGSVNSLHSQESLPQQRGRSSSKVSIARSVSRDRRDSGNSATASRRNRSVGAPMSRRLSSRSKSQPQQPQSQQHLNDSFVSVASAAPSHEPKSPTRVRHTSRTSSVGSDLGDFDDSRSVGYNRSSVRTPGTVTDAPVAEFRRVVLFRETQLSSSTTVAQLQRRLERFFEKYVGGSFGVPSSAGVASAPPKPQGRPNVSGQTAGNKLLFGTSSRSFGVNPDDDTGASDSVDSGLDDITALLSRSEKVEKSLMVFIDDLSLPSCDAWGDWHTAEAMREVLEQKGFHTADKQTRWQAMQGFQVLATLRHCTLGPFSEVATKGMSASPSDEPLEDVFTAARAKLARATTDRTVSTRGLPARLLSRFHVVHCSDPTPNDVRLWLFQHYSSGLRHASFAAVCALFTMKLWSNLRSVIHLTSPLQRWTDMCLHSIHSVARAVVSSCASLSDPSVAGIIRLVSHEFEREVVDRYGVATGAVICTYPNLDVGGDVHTISEYVATTLPASKCWLLQLAFRQSIVAALQEITKLGTAAEMQGGPPNAPLDSTTDESAPQATSDDEVHATVTSSWPTLQRAVVACMTEAREQCRVALSVATAERDWLKNPKESFDTVESVASSVEHVLPVYVNFATSPDSAADIEGGKLQPFEGVGVAHSSGALLRRFSNRKYHAAASIAAAQQRLEELWRWYADRSASGSLTSPTTVPSAKTSSVVPSIVLFEQVVTLVCRLARILALGGHHALLVGQPGIGKRTVATLAAYVASTSAITLDAPPESVSNRGSVLNSIDARGEPSSALIDDLRALVKQCSQQGRHVTVIVPEAVLNNESFAQFCAEYVGSHNIARLFSREELLSMAADAGLEDALSPQSSKRRSDAATKQKNLSVVIPIAERPDGNSSHTSIADGALSDESVVVLANALNARVAGRFRFVFCLSPEFGARFGGLSRWLDRHPNMSSQCTVNWYMPWSVAAKTSVAQGALSEMKAADGSFPYSAHDSSSTIPRVLAGMHEVTCGLVRAHNLSTVPTPQVFLTSLKWFEVQSAHVVSSIQGQLWALTTGLEKLSSARRDIQMLSQQAAGFEAELIVRSASLETLLADIDDKRASAAVEAEKIDEERSVVASEAEELTSALGQVEVELAAAQPAVQAALDSLKKVNPSDVATLRTLQQPPGLIKRIMDGVLILLQRPVGKTRLPPPAAPVFGQTTSASVIGQSLDESFLMPSWDLSFKLLASMSAPSFLKLLADFDLSTVNDETVELLAPYLEMPDFEERSARRVCGSMAGLCTWVRGMVAYHELIKTVKPKADAVAIAQQRVKLKNQQLAMAEAALQSSLDRLRLLSEQLLSAQASKAELEDALDGIRMKIIKANDLLDNMASEQLHWVEQKERLEKDLATCIPTALFAVAACLYAGPQPASLRPNLFQHWGDILVDQGIANRALVGSFVEAGAYLKQLVDFSLSSLWLSDGMSGDEQSCLSALCVEMSTQTNGGEGLRHGSVLLLPPLRPRTVLMIDPDGIGRRWIARRRRESGLVLLSAATGHVAGLSGGSSGGTVGLVATPEVLRQCMIQGKPLLVTDVGTVIHSAIRQIAAWFHGLGREEFAISDVLYHDSQNSAGTLGSCVFGGVDVSVKLGFELYLSISDAACRVDAEMLSLCTTVHFGANVPSLTSILLDAVVDSLHPDVNSRQQSLLSTSHSLASQVTDLNKRLLQRLSEGQGSLLDDPTLITVLRDMKRVHGDVEQRQQETKSAVASVDAVRNAYLPVAQAGAACYFANLDMQQLSGFYSMTLPRLLNRFLVGIKSCGAYEGVANGSRLTALRNAVVVAIATSMLRGISVDHEVTYRFHLASRLAGRVPQEELVVLRLLLDHRQQARSAQIQVATYRARAVQILSRLPALSELAVKLTAVTAAGSTRSDRTSEALRAWKEWLACETPENSGPPGTCAQALTPFQRMLVVCGMHPHRFVPALEAFIQNTLPHIPRGHLDTVLRECDANTPVLVLHADGQEAETWLQGLADANGCALKIGSVGTGQRGRIESLLKRSVQEGCWLALAGCHLAAMDAADDDTAAILHTVEAFVRSMSNSESTLGLASSFRLWLLADFGTVLPQPLVQLCIPIVVESGTASVADTIKRSLKRLPIAVLDDIEDIDNGLWRKLVFMLSVVHAAVSGRAKYARVGWSKRYKFSTADFLAAVDVFSAYVRDQQQEMSEVSIPWRQLQFVVLESVYGGRAADKHDLRVLRAYGDVWVHDVVTQMGHTFNFCRAVSNEGSVSPVLGWLAWKDVEPPMPPRDPGYSSHLSMKLLRLGSAANANATLRTAAAPTSMVHAHRRVSLSKTAPSPPDPYVDGDGSCLRAPTDSQAKLLSRFWDFVDSIDTGDHPEWLGIHPAFEVERKQANAVLVESCLMRLLHESDQSGTSSTQSVPSSTTALIQNLLQSIPAVKRLQVPTDAGWLRPIQSWLDAEIIHLHRVLEAVHTDALACLTCIRAALPLPERLVSVIEALAGDAIPPTWRDAIPETAKLTTLSSWLGLMTKNWQQLRGLAGSELRNWTAKPLQLSLSGMAHPVTLFEALRCISTSSSAGCSLDGVKLVAEVLSAQDMASLTLDPAPFARGVVLSGIQIIGAVWDATAGCLVDLPEGAKGTVTTLTPLFIRAVPATDVDVDHERSGSAALGGDVVTSVSGASDAPVGRVGPGAVTGLMAGDPDDADTPLSYFGPGSSRVHRVFSHTKLFACPLYRSSSRHADDHVFDVWIPASLPAQHWILRGVHLLL